MAFLIPKPKAPAAQPTPAAPERSDADIAEAAAQQRKKFYGGSPGRRSTLGAGAGLGVMGLYPTSAAKLLGDV
jgi:hypothetical protein